jgi:hypothetical protein
MLSPLLRHLAMAVRRSAMVLATVIIGGQFFHGPSPCATFA